MGKGLKWIRLIVAATAILTVIVFGGCDMFLDSDSDSVSDKDDGTVTLSLSNAGSAPASSWFAVFVFERGADPNTADGLVAVNYREISGGAVSDLVLEEPVNEYEPSGNDWIATGGRAYDLYAYTTDDGDLDYNTTSKVTLEYPDSLSVDGDFTQEFDYETDLVDAPTLTVEVTGADVPEVTSGGGITYFVALVMLDGEWMSLIDVEFTEATFSTLMENEIESTWLYETGTDYEVVFILSPNSIDDGPLTEGSYTLWTEMTFDQFDGHSTVTKDFGTLPVINENIIIDFDNMTFAPSDQNTWYGPYTPEDGTLTVSVSGADDHEGKNLDIAVVESGGVPSSPLAEGSSVISGGSATVTAQDGGGDWTGTGGTEYDVYIVIDVDNSGGAPNSGDYQIDPWPVTYDQDGDKVMNTVYSDDYVIVP